MTAQPEVHELDDEEQEQDEPGTALAQLTTSDAMVDTQVATAKRYPRSIAQFRKDAEALACLDAETAGECMYALPRSGKTIEGPSARFAEILLYAWTNARGDAEVIDEGETHLTAQGTFIDLQRNVAVRKKVKRRITDKHGRRYNDDMIVVTGNAAISIALRNAVFAGVPKAIWKAIYQKARLASIGKAGTLTQARQNSITWYGKAGVKPETLYAYLKVQGIEDITEDHVVTLVGLANAIKDGEISVEDAFSPRAEGAMPTPDLNARVKAKTAKPMDEDARARAEDAKLARDGK